METLLRRGFLNTRGLLGLGGAIRITPKGFLTDA